MSETTMTATSSTAITRGEVCALGLRTRYLQTGPASSAEAAVLIHGGGRNAEDWEDLLPRIGAFTRTVALDLPGFGHADRPRNWSGYTAQGWALFLGAALDRLDIRRVHLVVHDLGGETGLTWAAAHPDRLASVVAINGGILQGYRWHAIARLHDGPFGPPAVLAGGMGLRAVLRLYEPQLPRVWVERWVADDDHRSRLGMLRFYRATPAGGDDGAATVIRGLDPPAVVVWGAEDRAVPAAHAARLRETLPSGAVHPVQEAGHYPHLEAPERVAGLVVPFLRSRFGAT